MFLDRWKSRYRWSRRARDPALWGRVILTASPFLLLLVAWLLLEGLLR